MTTIVQALTEVMKDVGAVRKGERNSQQGFSFRGVDSVTQAVYPALVKHGVVVVPQVISEEYATVEVGKNRTRMGHVRLRVKFTWYGPEGDSIESIAAAESMDSGDKATAKAHSVAFRTAMLQTLCLPTDDPDPDAQVYERSAAPAPDPVREAKSALAAAVQEAGIDLALYARWAISAKGPGINIQASQDVKKLEELRADVEMHGKSLVDDFEPTGTGATTE